MSKLKDSFYFYSRRIIIIFHSEQAKNFQGGKNMIKLQNNINTNCTTKGSIFYNDKDDWNPQFLRWSPHSSFKVEMISFLEIESLNISDKDAAGKEEGMKIKKFHPPLNWFF